jgi:hypothetical protein
MGSQSSSVTSPVSVLALWLVRHTCIIVSDMVASTAMNCRDRAQRQQL